MTLSKCCFAEFLGTFWLVFGGCGSAVLAAAFPNLGIGFAGVALAFGLTLLTMAFTSGLFRDAILIPQYPNTPAPDNCHRILVRVVSVAAVRPTQCLRPPIQIDG
jgi:hypothetical protein